jgi:Cdc6-like AAA superfamily ATPase
MNAPMDNSLSLEESEALAALAAKVFQPRTPITTKELFAGRWNELTTVADAVNQSGLHAVIYGERGVGKTSLANVVGPTIVALDSYGKDPQTVPQRLIIKTVANSTDTFSSIWEKLFKDVTWFNNRPRAGLVPGPKGQTSLLDAFGLTAPLAVDVVRRVMQNLPPGSVLIIDEFDRAAKKTSREFTDLIKTLSDLAVDCTVVLVGVSDTIDQLIADHASIGRAITQVFLRRMTPAELRGILANAEKSLSIAFSEDAANLIVYISQGLPHYTHLVGLHAVRVATQRFSRRIEREDVFKALEHATKQAEQTAREKHSKATHSAHKDALYRHVLLACAVAAAQSRDPLGYFNPGTVVEPLTVILGRKAEVATFTNHLSEFCQAKRGPVLERDGQPRAYRFRFHDPMVVPFVFMDAVATGVVTEDKLASMLSGAPELNLRFPDLPDPPPSPS